MGQHQSSFITAELILKHLRGELTAREEAELAGWLAADPGHQQLFDSLQEQVQQEQHLLFFASVDTGAAWQKVAARTRASAPQTKGWQELGAWQYAAAVAGLLISLLTLIQLLRPPAPVAAGKHQQQVAPGGDRARITLADGTVIDLEEMANGAARESNGLRVTKKPGQVMLQFTGTPASQANTFTTIATPAAGQYQLVLPDSSKVWLNAASCLRLPASFNVRERVVELSGEAYFEVARQRLPFRVKTHGATVEVLGTHFNVMAYEQEASVNTTLVEGSVKVSQGTCSRVIVPGQQVRAGERFEVAEADIEEVLAWKNGFFQFNNMALAVVMRQIERWYDVEIVYQAGVPDKHFTGLISRKTPLPQVLNMLEVSGEINFKLEERSVLVLPAAD